MQKWTADDHDLCMALTKDPIQTTADGPDTNQDGRPMDMSTSRLTRPIDEQDNKRIKGRNRREKKETRTRGNKRRNWNNNRNGTGRGTSNVESNQSNLPSQLRLATWSPHHPFRTRTPSRRPHHMLRSELIQRQQLHKQATACLRYSS